MAGNRVKWWLYPVALLVAFAIGCMTGRRTAGNAPISCDKVIVKEVIVRDTITQLKPIERVVRICDTIPVEVVVRDTIKEVVFLPRTTKVYEDSLYRAEISGYEPSLDRIDIYRSDRIIYKDRTTYVPQRRRWSLGVGIGYGVGMNGGRIVGTPYVGIGVYYNLLQWGK